MGPPCMRECFVYIEKCVFFHIFLCFICAPLCVDVYELVRFIHRKYNTRLEQYTCTHSDRNTVDRSEPWSANTQIQIQTPPSSPNKPSPSQRDRLNCACLLHHTECLSPQSLLDKFTSIQLP